MHLFFRLFLFIGLLTGFLLANTIDVGLFYGKKIQQFKLIVERGEYQIPNLLEWGFYPSDTLKVTYADQTFFLSFLKETYEIASFSFQAVETGSIVKILIDQESRNYIADLFFSQEKNQILMIAKIHFLDYLEAVVQAEAGFFHHPEFYKVQSIVSRTYSLKNWYKHTEKGFNVCDQTHCQVFKGLLEIDSTIQKAIYETQDIVIFNQKDSLIDALFFSNSGGQTLNSENYWSYAVDYLRSVKDIYSIDQPNYLWEKKINKKLFYQYLMKEFLLNIPEYEHAFHFKHEFKQRSMYFGNPNLKISLKKIRTDWGLRSTFFTLEDLGEELLFKGKGYGHGVGLSQEGAMNMANQGFSYKDILKYYYKGIQIKNISIEKLISARNSP